MPSKDFFKIPLSLGLILFASCGGGGGGSAESYSSESSGDSSSSVEYHAQITPRAVDWLVLVYMDADNNLDSFADGDLKEIGSLTYNPSVKVAVLVDKYGNTGGFIYETDDNGKLVLSRTIPEPNMGDPQTLSDFVSEFEQNYPANHTVLIVWDHGTGWKSTVSSQNFKVAAVDDTDSDYLYTYELQEALKQLNKTIDILGFDECLMGNLEVLYAVKDFAKYMVASEQFEPGEGWNYTAAFKPLASNTENLTAESLAKNFVDSYAKSYSDKPSITMVLFTPTNVEKLVDGLNKISQQYLDNSDLKSKFQEVRANLDSLKLSDYDYELIDLYNFALGLNSTLNGNGTEEIISTVKALYRYTNDKNWQGVNLYFPDSRDNFDPDYLCQNPYMCNGYYNPFTQTLWDDVLEDYFGY